MPRASDKDKEIESLRAEIERLKGLAYKDELTRLYNRHGFRDGAEKFISELISANAYAGKRESIYIKNFSLIMFDIDDFKKLNDTYGHQVGDEALKRFAEVVMENVRDIDSAARWGGEEVVVGLVGASEDDAYRIAERIRERISAEKIKAGRKSITCTVSGGVSSMDDAESFEEVLERADRALYKAKREGKNRIIRHSEM